MFKEILQDALQTYQFPFTLPPANMGKTYRESVLFGESLQRGFFDPMIISIHKYHNLGQVECLKERNSSGNSIFDV